MAWLGSPLMFAWGGVDGTLWLCTVPVGVGGFRFGWGKGLGTVLDLVWSRTQCPWTNMSDVWVPSILRGTSSSSAPWDLGGYKWFSGAFTVGVPFCSVIGSLVAGFLVVSSAFGDLSSPSTSWSRVPSIDFSYGLMST